MDIFDQITFYIVVPVYKAENYIERCIESVLNQSYQRFKLVLVDDGSPDASGSICDRYAARDNRIMVIHQKNSGSLTARANGVKHIKLLGARLDDFIMFLDSDDFYKTNTLERICGVIGSCHCDMVIFGYDIVDVRNGKILKPYCADFDISFLEVNKRELYKRVYGNESYNSLWRKATAVKYFPDLEYDEFREIVRGEDLLQSIALYENIESVYFLKESLYNYSLNMDSITHNISVDNYRIGFTV